MRDLYSRDLDGAAYMARMDEMPGPEDDRPDAWEVADEISSGYSPRPARDPRAPARPCERCGVSFRPMKASETVCMMCSCLAPAQQVLGA